MKTSVTFSCLKHDGHACSAIGLGIAYVASYALKHLGGRIEGELFQLCPDFVERLEREIPKIACFSNYIWNTNLSYEFATRIKKKSPDSIIVFGGPNYPLRPDEQETFLLARPNIDFYIFREGEKPFVELFNTLIKYNFDVDRIKKDQLKISNCHYITEGEIVTGNLCPQVAPLDDIPSPYLTGLCDKLLDSIMIPIIQTKRGCPFKCTFCEDGNDYFNRVKGFSFQRIKEELHYIGQRAQIQDLMLADLNFGMYKDDLVVAREIAGCQKKYGWPKNFMGVAGKNNIEGNLQVTSTIPGTQLHAAVQSTDEEVLKSIKRDNISFEQHIEVAQKTAKLGSISFSELILGLPGDSKEKHLQSIFYLMDAGINVIRSHQLLMLPGAEASSKETRREFGMTTRFRVTPRTTNPYSLYGETFLAPEIDEICVASNTMSFQDYLDCRLFVLTVELFYNNGIFQEIVRFLQNQNISVSQYIQSIHQKAYKNDSPLAEIYQGFLQDTKELWESEEELKLHLKKPEVVALLLSQDQNSPSVLGNNEQLMFGGMAVFNRMEYLHEIALEVAQDLLAHTGCSEEFYQGYLKELVEFSLLRKQNMLTSDMVTKRKFNFDFIKLSSKNFKDDPFNFKEPEGVSILFNHSDAQKEMIANYIKVYGLSSHGLGYILGGDGHVSKLFRVTSVI